MKKWRSWESKTTSQHPKALLVGDNPFHNISHLSQDRTRIRGDKQADPERAASLILTAVENGANGFLFSVSDTTLAILKVLQEKGSIGCLDLYPIVPYAYEYVRLATQVGGIPGLAQVFTKRLVSSGSFGAMVSSLNGVLRAEPASLLKAYLTYEMNRVKAAAGKKAKVRSFILHEIIVDMALSFDAGWFFEKYSDFVLRHNLIPGFNTCNFPFLIDRLRRLKIDPSKSVIVAPFNKVGFQMNPSREACESALKTLVEPTVIAISILAAGYLSPPEAFDYVGALPNIRGVAVGVSKTNQAHETFSLLKSRFA